MPEAEISNAVCPHCEGRGWLVEQDGKSGTARPCECQKRERIPRRLQATGVPPIYGECRFANFGVKGAQAQLLGARSTAERYVDSFFKSDGHFRETGLLFIGPPGVGKTHLAVAVLLEAVRRYGIRGKFVDFTSLIHQIQSTFDPQAQESKSEVLDPVVTADLLLLDELGAQKPTAWVTDTLYLILNARYTQRRPTLFTTNYRLEAPVRQSLDRGADSLPGPELLSSRISAMLLSRLYEMAQPVVLEGVDFRQNVKSGRHL